MIQCRYCGAEYGDEEKVCPYCGSENVGVSLKEQQGFLDEMKRKKEQLNTVVPQEKAKKAVRKVHKTAVILVAFFLIFALLAAGYSIVRTKQARYRQQEHLRILEEYYVNNDFEGMYEYYWSNDDLYSATYDKYYKLSEIYRCYSYGKDYLDTDLEFLKTDRENTELWAEDIEYDLSCLFRALYLLDELERNGYVYNEKAGAEYLRQLILPVLKQTCMLTDPEILDGESRYEDYDTEYLDLAELVIGRVI